MRYLALACDYDGTIATHGSVNDTTLAALARVQESGRRLILVTGRRLDDLFTAFPTAELFDCIVAENGAVLYEPRRRRETLLTEAPEPPFIDALHAAGVTPIDVGKAIVATWEPHEAAVLETIHRCGLELQVTFNKGAIMVLPSGINKNSGLGAALHCLGLSIHNTVGVGDAENDQSFLTQCEFSVAVANALEAVKARVDHVTASAHGAGVEELIEALLENDLHDLDGHVRRHDIHLGTDEEGHEIRIPPHGVRMLICGPSGSGKSTIVSALLERLAAATYQFCIIDPEGDYESAEPAVTIGDETQVPTVDQVTQLLGKAENTVVSLLAVPIADRPPYTTRLLRRMLDMHQHDGRPHWLLLDEAHHMLPASWQAAPATVARHFASAVLVTVHPKSICARALSAINIAIAVGPTADRTLEELSTVLGRPLRPARPPGAQNLEVLVWFCREAQGAIRVRVEPAEAERRRHRRKYAEGDLQEKSFFFRGAGKRLKLRAQNLTLFLQMAEGVDADTWRYHLERGDYSHWVRTSIKDEALADQLQEIEHAHLAPEESLARVRAAVERLYTRPA